MSESCPGCGDFVTRFCVIWDVHLLDEETVYLIETVHYEVRAEAEETIEQEQVTKLVNPDCSTPTDIIEDWVVERISKRAKKEVVD
jgi:hypothetical protein